MNADTIYSNTIFSVLNKLMVNKETFITKEETLILIEKLLYFERTAVHNACVKEVSDESSPKINDVVSEMLNSFIYVVCKRLGLTIGKWELTKVKQLSNKEYNKFDYVNRLIIYDVDNVKPVFEIPGDGISGDFDDLLIIWNTLLDNLVATRGITDVSNVNCQFNA